MDTKDLDILSSSARSVLRLDVGVAYQRLVPIKGGSVEAEAILAPMSPNDVLSQKVTNQESATGVLAGLWLWHDFLHEAHELAQNMPSEDGSFWHAIMHRREGDFSNSKYWFARCENHPVYSTLALQAEDVIRPFPADTSLFRLTNRGWNPGAFVDLIERAHKTPEDPRYSLAVSLQQLEWRLLFDHCIRGAAAK